MRTWTRTSMVLTFAALMLVAVVGLAGCSSDDDKKSNTNANKLVGKATITPLSGRAPFTPKFDYKVEKSAGDVKIEWNFADGTKSTALSGEHEFKKPDFYAVQANATDEKGHEDNWNLVVRAYDKSVKKVSELPKDPKARESAVADQIKQTVLEYYTKYPSAMASDPTSDFYDRYPFLLPLYREHRALFEAREREVQKAIEKSKKQPTPEQNKDK